MIGASGERPSIGSVTTYMCSAAWSGTLTPAISPISRAQTPPQLTTVSQAMVPCAVRTPETAPLLRSKPVTAVSSKMRAPRLRAPLASAMAVSTGLVWPSPGM